MSLKYLLFRILGALPLLFGVSLILFAVLHLAPGSPLDIYTDNPAVTPEALERIRISLGLDQPLHIQYLSWIKSFAIGDWAIRFARAVRLFKKRLTGYLPR